MVISLLLQDSSITQASLFKINYQFTKQNLAVQPNYITWRIIINYNDQENGNILRVNV